MSRIINGIYILALLLVAACNKVGELPIYASGASPVLSASSSTIAPGVGDSTKPVVTLTWTDPNYAVANSSKQKFVVELDSAGGNFQNPLQYTLTGNRTFSLTGKQVNDLLVTWGFAFNAAHDINIRVLSSYLNNNEQRTSNVLTVKMTPYTVPFAVVASNAGPLNVTIQNKDNILEILSWSAPAYANATFRYVVQYDSAGKNFSKPTNITTASADSVVAIRGVDINTYAMNAGIAAGKQGALEFRVMATINGRQTIYSAAQKVTITPNVLLAVLHVPGNYQGWNPGTAPILASSNAINYEGYINFTVPNGFKFTNQPDWNGTNYGDAGNNTISTSGGDLNLPAAGFYLLRVNLQDLTWSATATSWGIIGAATPLGWDNSTPLTFNAANNTWVINSIALTAGEFKFRANNAWTINLGGNVGKLEYDAGNLSVAESGNYKVVLDLSSPLHYTATITKL